MIAKSVSIKINRKPRLINQLTKNLRFKWANFTWRHSIKAIKMLQIIPIIQNNKIIGAVNYVIVNDTKKGYGIFITTMLEEGDR